MSAPFLMWYDDNPKLSIAHKIEDAIGAYRHRWPSSAPTLVLVNEAEVTEVAGVEVRGVTTVRRNNVWVGLDGERQDHERREMGAKSAKGANAKGAKGANATATGVNPSVENASVEARGVSVAPVRTGRPRRQRAEA